MSLVLFSSTIIMWSAKLLNLVSVYTLYALCTYSNGANTKTQISIIVTYCGP